MSKHKHTPQCCIENYRMLIEYLWKNTNTDARQFIIKLVEDLNKIYTGQWKREEEKEKEQIEKEQEQIRQWTKEPLISCKNPSHIIQRHHSPC